jgi:hypothetical protein
MKGKNGIVGENTLWDGPLSQAGRPHKKGSSSGINGMEISKSPVAYKAGPITKRAK